MFLNNADSSSSIYLPATAPVSSESAESALYHSLFTMPAPINTISQDFCLFDADESSFDYPLFAAKSNNISLGTKQLAQLNNIFTNPLCTPQTPSLDLVDSSSATASASFAKPDAFGFDGCSAFLDDSSLAQAQAQQQQALLDTPFTPYLDTPMETPYLTDFGLEGDKVIADTAYPSLFSDFTFDFSAQSNVFTIEPNMLFPGDSQDIFATLPSPSFSDISGSTLSSAPNSPLKSLLGDCSDDEDNEFVSSRAAALVCGLKRNAAGAEFDLTPMAKKSALRPALPMGFAGAKKPAATKRFSCSHSGCDRRFARLFNLHTHEKTHDPEQARPFICPEADCAKAFSRKHDLQRHEASVHKGERNFACTTCKKPFSRQDGLRRHLAVKDSCTENGWLAT
ncbi:hypothetical protein BG006_008833 [Podila minutissima]|uniref:C2H2-type domain-containing protein n=1 Tax=Podila minutissima TaxID=64525 RepID=A0A9P5SFX6_9FUNG|nr:hypothetical protein BG006_008833 [Podila minutissima]